MLRSRLVSALKLSSDRKTWRPFPGDYFALKGPALRRLHREASMSSRFRVVEHVVRGQHTREYPAATANGDADSPVLAVKQYIPLSNPHPKPGDVTIIAAHANGFPKVCAGVLTVDKLEGLIMDNRRCTNRFGMRLNNDPSSTDSGYDRSGSPTSGSKDSPAC